VNRCLACDRPIPEDTELTLTKGYKRGPGIQEGPDGPLLIIGSAWCFSAIPLCPACKKVEEETT